MSTSSDSDDESGPPSLGDSGSDVDSDVDSDGDEPALVRSDVDSDSDSDSSDEGKPLLKGGRPEGARTRIRRAVNEAWPGRLKEKKYTTRSDTSKRAARSLFAKVATLVSGCEPAVWVMWLLLLISRKSSHL